MTKLLTIVVFGSGAFFTWQAVDADSLPVPVRLWALLVFVVQVGVVAALWLKK
jgi:hypothetical protein